MAARGEGAAVGEADETGGMGAHQVENLAEGQAVGAVEDAEGEAKGGFEAGDAIGRALELDLLLMRGMGSVVGGDAVDGAVPGSSCSGCRRRAELRR